MAEETKILKDIRVKIDADTYAKIKNEMYKRKIYKWREFFQYIVNLLEKEDLQQINKEETNKQ